jgi:hypothetical protein
MWRHVLFVIALCLVAPAAQAIVLYRADIRPPSRVFAEGFVGPGTNMDFFRHLGGSLCLGSHGAAQWTTAYVTMTERASDVADFGTYVYNIVPEEGGHSETAVYDAYTGLVGLRERWQMFGLNPRQRERVQSLLLQASVYGQHIARRVAPESIQAVDVYQYDATRNETVLVRREVNPRFRMPERSGSLPTFSGEMLEGIQPGLPSDRIHLVQGPDGESRGLCLLPGDACFDRAPHRMVTQATALFPNAGTCVVRPMALPNGPFQQALQIILD